MDYKAEIIRLTSRIPQKVKDGDYTKAVGWKIVAEKSLATARKRNPSEAELVRAHSNLIAYE